MLWRFAYVLVVFLVRLERMLGQALLNRCHLWVERVPTHDNVSDLPSREAYELMMEIGAIWRPPALAKLFVESSCHVGTQPCQG